jgi:hypothetical protein
MFFTIYNYFKTFFKKNKDQLSLAEEGEYISINLGYIPNDFN